MYFQFDALRQIAAFCVENDVRAADQAALEAATGLPFASPYTHPWRNYSRILKLCLLVSEVGDQAQPTPVAARLAMEGQVTSDEYFHFIARAFTEPAYALQDWRPDAAFRYPLLFSLKYLLAKAAIGDESGASLDEILGAYAGSDLSGEESDEEFIHTLQGSSAYAAVGADATDAIRRQARESLRVLAQISYLFIQGDEMLVALAADDAETMFEELQAIIGPRAADREAEIRRLAELFVDGSTEIIFDFPGTVVGDVEESGFQEGTKVKRTHITIERNSNLRNAYYSATPTSTCDLCALNTEQSYPWTARVLDLHHLLPLSSGMRVEMSGTTLDDLVPLCPTCHRAVHRFYDVWMKENDRHDFADRDESRAAYEEARMSHPGSIFTS